MANSEASHAISTEGMAPEGAIDNQGLQGHTTAPSTVHHVADPVDNVLGLTSTGWVAVAALIVIGASMAVGRRNPSR